MPRRRGLVDEQHDVGWRRRTEAGQAVVDRAVEGAGDGRGLRRAGNDDADRPSGQDRRHRHRQGQPRARHRSSVECAVADLLVTTRVVDLDRLDLRRVVEVRHVRVVEGDMAVLADPDEGEVETAIREERAVAGRTRPRGRPVVAIELLHPPGLDDAKMCSSSQLPNACSSPERQARRTRRGGTPRPAPSRCRPAPPETRPGTRPGRPPRRRAAAGRVPSRPGAARRRSATWAAADGAEGRSGRRAPDVGGGHAASSVMRAPGRTRRRTRSPGAPRRYS